MALDPRVQLLMWLAALSGQRFRRDAGVEAMRATYARTNRRFGLNAPGVTVREFDIPAEGRTIKARLYLPEPQIGSALPVLLYFHGGGWVIGDIDCYDGLMRFLAHEGGIAVVSAEYRLGPEHRFPAAFEDAFSAYAWLRSHAADLGLQPDAIAVGGDSAGGGIAASVASYAASRGLERPAFAFLIYPAVDATGRSPSRKQYAGNLPLTPETIEWFSRHAIANQSDKSDPLFVPLDAPDPQRHPPAYILAAQYDPLVDEGRAYYERLRDAGVGVTYDLRSTLPHAFVNMAALVPEGRRAVRAGIRATAAALGVRRVAALTGAGSGIGRALAIELSSRGYALALADRDEETLDRTKELIGDRGPVTVHVLDVAQEAQVGAFAAAVLNGHGRCDVLINNAGVTIFGYVSELSTAEIAWLMDINFWGTVYGVKAFLPEVQRVHGTIVNLSSVFGLFGPPGQSAYAASKFAVRGFSESLREEVRRSGVTVLTVHPGGIKTAIARNGRIAAAADQDVARRRAKTVEERMLTLPPEQAAKAIAQAIDDRRERLLIGADAFRIDLLTRSLGPLGSRLISRRLTGSNKT